LTVDQRKKNTFILHEIDMIFFYFVLGLALRRTIHPLIKKKINYRIVLT